MPVGIAVVHGDRVLAMCIAHAGQPAGDLGQRLVPFQLYPVLADPLHRAALRGHAQVIVDLSSGASLFYWQGKRIKPAELDQTLATQLRLRRAELDRAMKELSRGRRATRAARKSDPSQVDELRDLGYVGED